MRFVRNEWSFWNESLWERDAEPHQMLSVSLHVDYPAGDIVDEERWHAGIVHHGNPLFGKDHLNVKLLSNKYNWPALITLGIMCDCWPDALCVFNRSTRLHGYMSKLNTSLYLRFTLNSLLYIMYLLVCSFICLFNLIKCVLSFLNVFIFLFIHSFIISFILIYFYSFMYFIIN